MPVDPTSRYAGLPQIAVVAADGRHAHAWARPRVAPEPPLAGRYQVRPGDRLDLMAPPPPATPRAGGCWPTPTPLPTPARRAAGRRRSDCPVPDTTRLLVEVDGNALSDDDLRGLTEIQVEEATEIADAATLVGLARGGPDRRVDVGARSAADAADQGRHPGQPRRDDLPVRGPSTEARLDDQPAGRLAALGHGRRPHLELDNEEKIVAWPGCSDSVIAETIFTLLWLRDPGRLDAGQPRPGRARRAAAWQRPHVRARAGREVGIRGVPGGGRGGCDRPLPPDRPAGRAAGRAGAGIRRRCPERLGRRTPARRSSGQGVTHPGAV